MSTQTVVMPRNQTSPLSATQPNNDVTALDVAPFGQMTIPPHDAVDVTYTGTNPTTIEYYVGGLAGTLVATVTNTFNGSNNLLTSVVTYP